MLGFLLYSSHDFLITHHLDLSMLSPFWFPLKIDSKLAYKHHLQSDKKKSKISNQLRFVGQSSYKFK